LGVDGYGLLRLREVRRVYDVDLGARGAQGGSSVYVLDLQLYSSGRRLWLDLRLWLRLDLRLLHCERQVAGEEHPRAYQD
jgi:hypothetical protein